MKKQKQTDGGIKFKELGKDATLPEPKSRWKEIVGRAVGPPPKTIYAKLPEGYNPGTVRSSVAWAAKELKVEVTVRIVGREVYIYKRKKA